jgi:glycine betaine/proline transport system permease protein
MLAFLQENLIPEIPLEDWTNTAEEYITDSFGSFFDFAKTGLENLVDVFEAILIFPPELVMVGILSLIAFFIAGWRVAVFSVIGFLLIIGLRLWDVSMESLALVLASTVVALAIGIPLGILVAQSRNLESVVTPALDVMQTLPAFVYLVPLVVLLGLGAGPALVAVVVFAMPPAVRLTMLGIRQVPKNTVEAAHAFGATPWQTLWKVELPQALPTIMAGVNQVIMLALSMVVIAGLVGAGGLGDEVVRGLGRLDVGQAFVGGLGIVIIAIYLDRVSRNLSTVARRTTQKKGVFSKALRREKKQEPEKAAA